MLAADCGTDVTPPLGPGNSDPEEAEKSLAKQVDFWSFGFFFVSLPKIPDKIVLANFVCLFFVNKVSRRLWNVSAGL